MNHIIRDIVRIILCTATLLSLNMAAHAKPDAGVFNEKPLPPSSSDTSYLGTEEEVEFVKVDQAYQVYVSEEENTIKFDWNILEGYYLYQHRFKVIAQNSEQKEVLAFTYTPGKKKFDEYFGKELEVHYHSALVTSDLPTLKKPYEIIVTSQGCADAGLCYPPRKQYFKINTQGGFQELDFSSFKPKAASATSANGGSTKNETEASPLTSNTKAKESPVFIMVLLGAIFGGLILNLMPCVFPVLSLKALSFASTDPNEKNHSLHGWAYTLGVVGSFLVAATFILVAKSAGETLGWGFQLQHPGFVAVMAYLFLGMGLSLSGVVHFGTSLMGVGNDLTTSPGLKSSFFTGVLAALVASPCTAPFMGTALGYAITQPAYVSLTVFAALGFGMALPFLALSYSPTLARFLPRPGAWMDTLKQFLAFPLYVTCVWLIWVLGRQTSMDAAALFLLGGTAIAFAAWLTTQAPQSQVGKALKVALIVLSLASAVWVIPTSSSNSSTAAADGPWRTYSPEGLATLRAESTPVFIDLTADWCITCKVNERVALSSDKFFNAANEFGVVLMKGDYTNADPLITALLEKYERNGVPLYLMYPSDNTKDAEILPQILTTSMVINAMELGSN